MNLKLTERVKICTVLILMLSYSRNFTLYLLKLIFLEGDLFHLAEMINIIIFTYCKIGYNKITVVLDRVLAINVSSSVSHHTSGSATLCPLFNSMWQPLHGIFMLAKILPT